MPRVAFLLLAANVALGAYLIPAGAPVAVRPDVRALELNAEKVTIVRPAGKDDASEPRAAAAQAACLEWGAFGAAELERAQAELAGLGAARTVVRELGPAPAWWVHIPPHPSREEAERRVREIEAAGVRDVRIVAEGGRWRNAVSLGIFRNEEAAAAALARLREAGVANAAIAQRSDLLRLASIVIVEPAPELAARIAELRAAYPGTELKALACPAEAA